MAMFHLKRISVLHICLSAVDAQSVRYDKRDTSLSGYAGFLFESDLQMAQAGIDPLESSKTTSEGGKRPSKSSRTRCSNGRLTTPETIVLC